MPAEADQTKTALAQFGQNIVALIEDYKGLKTELAAKDEALAAAQSELNAHVAAHAELQSHISQLDAYRANAMGENVGA